MNIVINGGTRGIGLELVKIFTSDEKNKIVVMGRNVSTLSNLEGDNLLVLKTDMTDFEKSEYKTFTAIKEFLTEIDILINNAGTIIVKGFGEVSAEEARRLMEVNFIGPASVIRALRPLMKNGSHIVNISSMGGFQGSSKYNGLSYYSASKAALSCLSECLAGEFNSEGIRVNCLALGAVQTEMLEEAFPGYRAPIAANEMARYIADFAVQAGKVMNGKVVPVAISNP